jgi:hypothetical protein
MNSSTGNIFCWDGDRNAALVEARRSGCVLGLWFRLAQVRERRRSEFAAWLQRMHAKYASRFGRLAVRAAR